MFQKIPTRSRSCDRCARPFEVHEHYYTLLLPGEDEGWVRSDHCASCYEERPSAVRWRSAIPPKPPKEERQPLSVEERLLALLAEEKSPVRALLLALYLERQGVLQRTGRRQRKSGLWLDFAAGDMSFSVLHVDIAELSSEIQDELVADLHQLAEPDADLAESARELAAFEEDDPEAAPTIEEMDVVCLPSETS